MVQIDFTLKQMQVFLEVVEKGSALAASKSLGISQPAVSASLVELEKNLGTPLFHRWKKRVIINERGRDLVQMARVLHVYAEEISRTFKEQENTVSGSLKLGASTTLISYILPSFISGFISENPKVIIDTIGTNKRGIVEQIEAFELDIGIIAGASNRPNVKNTFWLKDELCVFASVNHPLASKDDITLNDLLDFTWITREKGSGTLEVFLNALSGTARPLKVQLTFNNPEAIKSAVESSELLSCISIHAIKKEVESGSLKVLPTPFLDLKRVYSFITHRERYQSQLLKYFMGYCFAKS